MAYSSMHLVRHCGSKPPKGEISRPFKRPTVHAQWRNNLGVAQFALRERMGTPHISAVQLIRGIRSPGPRITSSSWGVNEHRRQVVNNKNRTPRMNPLRSPCNLDPRPYPSVSTHARRCSPERDGSRLWHEG